MFYSFVKAVLSFVVRIWFRYRIVDLDKAVTEGPVIVSGNHNSMWDIVAMAAAYPRKIHFIGKKELREVPVLGFLFSKLDAIFIDREANDIESMRASLNVLKNGDVIGIFPEGTRTTAPDPKNMKAGVSFLSMRGKAPIQPVRIESDFKFRHEMKVTFRNPISFEDYSHLPRKEALDQMAIDIFNEIYMTNYTVEALRDDAPTT